MSKWNSPPLLLCHCFNTFMHCLAFCCLSLLLVKFLSGCAIEGLNASVKEIQWLCMIHLWIHNSTRFYQSYFRMIAKGVPATQFRQSLCLKQKEWCCMVVWSCVRLCVLWWNSGRQKSSRTKSYGHFCRTPLLIEHCFLVWQPVISKSGRQKQIGRRPQSPSVTVLFEVLVQWSSCDCCGKTAIRFPLGMLTNRNRPHILEELFILPKTINPVRSWLNFIFKLYKL